MSLYDLPCMCASLRRAARAVTQRYDEALRPAGIRLTQFTLLQVLSLTGPLTQGVLGQQLAMDSTTLSRTLLPVEKAGWIRSRPGSDRRERYVEVTKAGLKTLSRVTPVWEAAQEELRRRLGEDGWAALGPMLTATTRAARTEL
jgi:DNA-binding MarR family transcriptional regulator